MIINLSIACCYCHSLPTCQCAGWPSAFHPPSSSGSEAPTWLFLRCSRTLVSPSNAPTDTGWVIMMKLGAAGHSDHPKQVETREGERGREKEAWRVQGGLTPAVDLL